MGIKPPKTRAGARFCPLTKDVIDAAKTFDFSQLNPDKIEGYWQRQKEKQGFKFKFHAFRHYWASLQHANGMPDQYIAKIGGWSSVEMVQRVYGHALRDKTPEFSNQVIEIFNNEGLTSLKKTQKRALCNNAGRFFLFRGNFRGKTWHGLFVFAEKSLSYVQNNFATENTKSPVFKPLLKLSA